MPDMLVAALYKFVDLTDYEEMRDGLASVCRKNSVFGTLLLAREGINGTIAGPPRGVRAVLHYLRTDARLFDLEHRESRCGENPFYRMKVRLKREIVTMGVPEVDPVRGAGSHVEAVDWNALISDPDTVLIDTRNDYEVAIGTFKGAIDPGTANFRDFPAWLRANRDKLPDTAKIAMFCTGGIRCEKATALARAQGFQNVFHLRGGILKYLETVSEQESLWKGECFVFDSRVSVGHGLKPGQYDLCHACRHPISREDKTSPLYEAGISCPHCHGRATHEQRARFRSRQKQIELARTRGERHVAADLEKARVRKLKARGRG